MDFKKELENIRRELAKQNETIAKQQKDIYRLKARFNAFEARMYARGRSNRISRRDDDYGYRQKVSQWHNQFHAKTFTPQQIAAMKADVGDAYTTRKAYRQSGKKPPSNKYGSMKTESLGAVGYAMSRQSNRASSHAPSNAGSSLKSTGRSKPRKR